MIFVLNFSKTQTYRRAVAVPASLATAPNALADNVSVSPRLQRTVRQRRHRGGHQPCALPP